MIIDLSNIVSDLREVGTEDLVTFTSSKKSPSPDSTEEEAEVKSKDTDTSSKEEYDAENESDIKDTESPSSSNSVSGYSSPLKGTKSWINIESMTVNFLGH